MPAPGCTASTCSETRCLQTLTENEFVLAWKLPGANTLITDPFTRLFGQAMPVSATISTTWAVAAQHRHSRVALQAAGVVADVADLELIAEVACRAVGLGAGPDAQAACTTGWSGRAGEGARGC
jgi:hypothetical protein